MKTVDLISGLHILLAYYDKRDGHYTCAEHDIFYAYPTNRPLADDDVKRMAELGWFQEGVKPEDADEWRPEHYDPSEGWAAFT